MKKIILKCEQCNIKHEFTDEEIAAMKLVNSFGGGPNPFPLWPFIPATMQCTKCGSAVVCEIIKEEIGCQHEWVDGDNEVVKNTEICKKCKHIRPKK